MTDPNEVRAKLDVIIVAMKTSGAWDVVAPPADALSDMGAFGMNTMAFEQWLRFVFVPNVEALIASDGPWPRSSQVAVHAAREGDGNPQIAELVGPLSAFDEIFEPKTADEPYEQSLAALAKGEHEAATKAIDEAIAIDPAFANAHNFAGWILMQTPSRTPAQIEAAIEHFRAAAALDPASVAAANLCDALVLAGREPDAVREAERLHAHNWLGVHWMKDEKTLPIAIEQLELAVRARPFCALAHVNLAKALEVAHRSDDAYMHHDRALATDDDFDRAFSYERRAAYEARHGWFRNALRSFRAALREDAKRGGAREATYREAMEWLESQMRAAGIEWAPPERDETAVWLRACELELPPGFGVRNEAGELLADDVIEVERLVRAERWQDAIHHLEALKVRDAEKLIDALGFAERGANAARRAGHLEEAKAMMRLVVDGYVIYASGATSGGEGMGRMAEVDAKRAKLREWERE